MCKVNDASASFNKHDMGSFISLLHLLCDVIFFASNIALIPIHGLAPELWRVLVSFNCQILTGLNDYKINAI